MSGPAQDHVGVSERTWMNEMSEFPDLAAQYHVHGVPKVVMNDPWNSSALSRRLRSWTQCSRPRPEYRVESISTDLELHHDFT